MKKYLLIIVGAAFATATLAQSSWRWGLTLGSAQNSSKFTGGMANASALFDHTTYQSGQWGVLFRKTLSAHFSLQTGLKGVGLGFEYGMAQDYSLLKQQEHHNWNRIHIGSVQIPVSLIWNSKPNCSNMRWYVGAGGTLEYTGAINKDKNLNTSNEVTGNTGSSGYLEQSVNAGGGATVCGNLLFGVERTFNSGRMLNMGFWFNKGFMPIATSNVTYTADNQTYNHTFTNYGSYAGVTISYYFKPFGSRKAAKAAAMKLSRAIGK